MPGAHLPQVQRIAEEIGICLVLITTEIRQKLTAIQEAYEVNQRGRSKARTADNLEAMRVVLGEAGKEPGLLTASQALREISRSPHHGRIISDEDRAQIMTAARTLDEARSRQEPYGALQELREELKRTLKEATTKSPALTE